MDVHGSPTLDRVAEALRNDIVTGAIPAASRINQSELARKYGVSRIPIRDALRILEREGFVEVEHGGGALIPPVSLMDLEEIYELREVVEPVATAIALPNIGRSQTVPMEQLCRLMEDTEDEGVWLAANGEFHRLIYAQSNRRRTITLIDNLTLQANRYLRLHSALFKEKKEVFEQQHADILDAVRSRDVDALHEFTAEHLVTAHEGLIYQFLGQSSTPPGASTQDRSDIEGADKA